MFMWAVAGWTLTMTAPKSQTTAGMDTNIVLHHQPFASRNSELLPISKPRQENGIDWKHHNGKTLQRNQVQRPTGLFHLPQK